MFLDYFSLFLLFFIAVVIFYGVIVIHDIPYEMAVKRNHPHQDAIHVAGWVSLFTLHVLWPFLWIWATLWREERGWGFVQIQEEQKDLLHQLTQLSERVAALESDLDNDPGSDTQVEQSEQDRTTGESAPLVETSTERGES